MNFTIFWICIITIIGFVLRFIGLDKDGGLWNDEYISWFIASAPTFKGFVDGILSQCHMPLYYIYLKIVMLIGGDNDLVLRFSSIIPAVASIPVMYMVGREKTKFTGLMCALFTALSSFLIYYSQEVRFYTLLFLFSALSLYFTIRILKKPNKKNFIGLIISNFLILFTHTIGFVYVFFDIIFICYYLRHSYKKIVNLITVFSGVTLVIASPLIIKIFTTVSFSQWWAQFSFRRIIQLFSDYFTPVLSKSLLLENLNSIDFNSICLILPLFLVFIVFFAIILDKNIRRESKLGLIALGTFIVLIIASMSGKLVLEAKYAIEIYPILIFLFCATIDFSEKVLWFKILLFTFFFGFQVLYIISPNYASFLPREEGNKYVAKLIKSANLKNDDFIILTYYPKNRFEKYINFDKYNVIEIHKGNFNEYFTPEISYKEAVKSGKQKYKGAFVNSIRPVNKFTGDKLIDEINENVYYKMKKGQKVAFLFLDSVSFLDENIFANILTDQKAYKNAPLLFLIFSDIRNEIIKTLPVNAKNMRYEVAGSWTLVSFEY